MAVAVSLLVARRIGIPIFSVVPNASFTNELLISINR
jgi:hypothetical protein